ncbi:MAG: DUF4291 domain-containing protein [Bdellovibrionales bacterium]|nr:DUF4291 domain-containing protein [Bdellovibrionales bacterium]
MQHFSKNVASDSFERQSFAREETLEGLIAHPDRAIRADFDRSGIFVYQAFNSEIANYALENGRFGRGFRTDRTTWVKPSFGWMLYRSNFARNPNQERILRIKLNHEGFNELLSAAVLTKYDSNVHGTKAGWDEISKRAKARVQWDPERFINKTKHPNQRAIQLGIGPLLIERYNSEWIESIQDATHHAERILTELKKGMKLTEIESPFVEMVFSPPKNVMRTLGMLLCSSTE